MDPSSCVSAPCPRVERSPSHHYLPSVPRNSLLHERGRCPAAFVDPPRIAAGFLLFRESPLGILERPLALQPKIYPILGMKKLAWLLLFMAWIASDGSSLFRHRIRQTSLCGPPGSSSCVLRIKGPSTRSAPDYTTLSPSYQNSCR